ncbi:MAG: maltokinase N-terminal cap-like domain-containing protein [Aquihabitans sp.]
MTSTTDSDSTASSASSPPDRSAVTAEWLHQQRWYAGKASDASPGDARVIGLGDGLTVSLLDVGDDCYQLLSRDDRPDSLDDPATASALVEALRSQRAASDAAGEIRFHLVPDTEIGDGAARPMGAEQSNSSLVVDDRWILKVFRRVQGGTNPELEVLRFLADRAAPHVPRLAGWYELRNGSAEATLGVLQALVPDAADGWRWVLEHLPWRPQETVDALHQLGGVIADLHRALASGDPDDGFGSTAGGTGASRTIASGIAADAERVASMVPTDRADIRTLLEDAGRVAHATADGLDSGRLIRVHGDLHLGQLLVGAEGWTVIDWEGEPSRSLAERRALQPALRDVAGLLRSLSYAVATVQRESVGHPLAGWLAAARAALLDGYLERADPELLPPSAVGIRDQLALLELEKLVYEVGYEAANRPGWLDIPIAGLAAAIARDRAA